MSAGDLVLRESAPARRSRVPKLGEFAQRLFMNSAQAAEMLGVSPKTLADWRDAGVIPYYRIGERRRGCTIMYKRQELLARLEQFRVADRDEVDAE